VLAQRGGDRDRAVHRRAGSAGAGARIWRTLERGAAESAQGSGVKARGSRSGLDEVVEDSQDLLGIGDNGEDPHLGTTAGAAQRVNLVNLCEQSCPGGAGLLDRHGLIQGAREAVPRLRAGCGWWSFCHPVEPGGQGRACGTMCHGSARNTTRSDESGGCRGQEGAAGLDKELCGGEQLGLCVEVRIGLMLTLHSSAGVVPKRAIWLSNTLSVSLYVYLG